MIDPPAEYLIQLEAVEQRLLAAGDDDAWEYLHVARGVIVAQISRIRRLRAYIRAMEDAYGITLLEKWHALKQQKANLLAGDMGEGL